MIHRVGLGFDVHPFGGDGPLVMGGRDAQMVRDFYENVLKHNPFADAIRIAPRVCVALYARPRRGDTRT